MNVLRGIIIIMHACMHDYIYHALLLLYRQDSTYLQTKYIVFESNLLTLFRQCEECGGINTSLKKIVIGTFLRLQQSCDECGHIRKCESQPFLSNIPAGNILMSASILYSGALPSKALHIMSNLKIASISLRTFFNHQLRYLQPAIYSVWKSHQSFLLDELKREKRKLIIGGDGRADSPGHCAKFGSYSVLELKKGAVIDIQLVQVYINFLVLQFLMCDCVHVINRVMKFRGAIIWRKKDSSGQWTSSLRKGLKLVF